MMRTMRAYAGETKRLVYVILWYIFMYQLVMLVVIYYKRYFVLALLITIFPIVLTYYVIEVCNGKNPAVFSNWCKEFVSNIFIQSIHAIMYSLILGVILSQSLGVESQRWNWLIMIVATLFIFKGESILKKILGAAGSTLADEKGTRKAIKGAYGNAKKMIGK